MAQSVLLRVLPTVPKEWIAPQALARQRWSRQVLDLLLFHMRLKRWLQNSSEKIEQTTEAIAIASSALFGRCHFASKITDSRD